MNCPVCGSEKTEVLRTMPGAVVWRQHRCPCGARWRSLQQVDPETILIVGVPGYWRPPVADQSGSARGSPLLGAATGSNGGVGGGLPKNLEITSRFQTEIFEEMDHRSGSNRITPNDPIQRGSRRRRSTLPLDHSAAFLAFWSAYPRKVAKAKAWETWFKKGMEAKGSLIQTAIGWQAREIFQPRIDAGEPENVPHPATWLNQQRWEDERPARSLRSVPSGDGVAALKPLPKFTPRPRDEP